MSYLASFSDLYAFVPERFVTEALDDDADGAPDADAWELVAAATGDQIDSRLEGRFDVPFDAPYPAIIREAALVFAAEMLYMRRGQAGEANPHTTRANGLRAKLDAIGQGKAPLAPEAGQARKHPPISIVSAPAKTAGSGLLF